jgi:methylornithine synthase
MQSNFKRIDDIINRIEIGKRLESDEIKCLLAVREPMLMAKLFAAARHMREQFFGNRVFLYGFVYFSTFCKNDCRFCHFRKSNSHISRYRKTIEEVIGISLQLEAAGVHLIDLTMGEDPMYMDLQMGAHDHLVQMVRMVKDSTRLPVMVSPGVVNESCLSAIVDAGADWYACYQETHSIDLYNRLRFGQEFQERLQSKILAKMHGMLIEEGIMTGVGESLDDLTHSIERMRQLDADQVRVMTFVPQGNTPMSGMKYQGRTQELVTLAVLRSVFPDRLIPASLDIDGLDGLKDRLNAGANVITSLVEPSTGLAGVANHALDIDNARRTPEAVMPVVYACGLKKATRSEYTEWLSMRRRITCSSQEPYCTAV